MNSENQTAQQSDPPIQFDDQTKAMLEALFATRLQEQADRLRAEAQAREEAWRKQEKTYENNDASLRAVVESLSGQLREARLENPSNTNINKDVPMSQPATTRAPSARRSSTADSNSPTPSTLGSSRPTRRKSGPASLSERTQRSSTRSSTPKTVPVVTPTTSHAQRTPKPSKPAPVTEMVVAKKPIKKPAAHVHRLLMSEVPANSTGVQMSMKLHVRLLWGLFDPKQPPPTPNDKTLHIFALRFHDESSLMEAQAGGSLVAPERVHVGVSITDRGVVASQLRRIEEHIIEYIQACLSRFGLLAWGPDLRQTPYTLYNAACRIIALDTFKQALASHAYAHLAPNLAYAKDMVLLVKLYDHFVHHYLQQRYQKECRVPGSVRAADEASPQYHNRQRLANARLKFLEDNGYPQRYRDLIDAKATSDDEPDPKGRMVKTQKIHLIKRRTERSQEFEEWVRILDRKRKEDTNRDPTKRWRERPREVPLQPQDSEFTALPEGMPIDYYDPDFYNSLQPRLRAQITNTKVALLPDVTRSFMREADERLSDKQFSAKYEAKVLAKYRVVEDEFEVEDDSDWLADDDDDDDEDMSDDDDDVEEYEVVKDVDMLVKQ